MRSGRLWATAAFGSWGEHLGAQGGAAGVLLASVRSQAVSGAQTTCSMNAGPQTRQAAA
jgi:hypothetical protein